MQNSSNNPFRSKTAFTELLPTARQRKQFKSEINKSDPEVLAKKVSEWGKVKFNPTAKPINYAPATPWLTLKTDMIKNKTDMNISLVPQNNEPDTKDKKLKQHKLKIQQKLKEPTKWEDFSEKRNKPKREFINNPFTIRDPNNLTEPEKNILRKIITKTTMQAKANTNLRRVVKDLKRRGVARKTRN